MRVADYIFKFLADHGVKHVFLVTGGGAMFLNNGLLHEKRITPVCCHNEQGAAVAAEGYARVTGKLAAVSVTTGPGGTNAMTGLIGEWLDSQPVIYISGQVKLVTSLFSESGETEITARSIRRVSKDGESAVNVLFCGNNQSEVHGERVTVTGREYLVLVRCSSHGSPLSLDEFAGESYESLLSKHTAIHTPLYDAVTIELAAEEEHARTNEQMLDEAYDDEASPALIERLWRFGRYLFISAASADGNPVPLYGLWHGADGLPWAQYVANENVEMTYWHAMAGRLSYAVPPLLRYYASKLEKFRECAKKMFGMRGIWISAYG